MPAKLTVGRPDDFIPFQKKSILQGIHQRIEEQVRLYPEKPALFTLSAAYTYAEMNASANSLAAEILTASGSALAQVAILQSNTPELIVSILACLKAHKAYVPLDCNFPPQRLRAMLEDCEPLVLLTDHCHLALAEELAGKRARIINTSATPRHPDAPNPDVPCDPLDRAYILYTSGSTGRPKGIEFLHRNLLHTTMCLTNELFFAPSDRVSWLHSPSFGASVVDIYCCLTNGGTLYPWDPKTQGFTGMANWLARNRLTTFQWIPSAFRQFMRTVDDERIFSDIRIVVMASEPLSRREVELFRRHFPKGSHLVNQVGTGESYNYRLYPVDHQLPIEQANVAGGYPVSSEREVIILDGAHKELPRGEVGQIAIRSDYMSAGYWHDPALTKAKFIHTGNDQTPVYLTGDLGKLEPDGCLIHLGRNDFQVKIRGFRIETAEIDQVLAGAPGILESVTWIARNRRGEDQLVAYVVLQESRAFDQEAVKAHLQSRLPDYMVPSEYVVLDCLPALPTGKLDRGGLLNPFERRESRPSATEEIKMIFEELLQSGSLSPDANFFDCGGDSLLSAVLMHRISQRFRAEVTLDEFLQSPTPRGLAAALSGGCRDSITNGPAPGLPAVPAFTRVTVSRANPSSTKQNLVIIGAGQFGREVLTWAAQAIDAGAPWRIKGFLDSRHDALAGYQYEARVLGDVDTYQIEMDDVFVGAIGDPRSKFKAYSPIAERGGRFINLIHPLANLGNNVALGAGIVLAPFSSITSDVKIGNHVAIGAFSNAGHDTVLGEWCQIGSHCGINGTARLGEGVTLGSHACVIPGVTVGPWAYVGAGSVVLRDVVSCCTVFGNPAAPVARTGPPMGREQSARPGVEAHVC